MLEELLKQIGEVAEGDGAGKSGKDPGVNIIIGNSGTVVIGDGSKGSASEDRDQESSDDSHASMQGMMREIEKLRAQVRQLIKAVRKLFLKTGDDGFKDWREAKRGRLKTEGTNPFPASFVSKYPQLSNPPFRIARPRAIPGLVPIHSISSHFIPGVSEYLASHIQWPTGRGVNVFLRVPEPEQNLRKTALT